MSEKSRRFKKEEKKSGIAQKGLIAVIAALVLVAGLAFTLQTRAKKASTIEPQISLELETAAELEELSSTKQIKVAVADVNDGKARYFDYTLTNGTTVKYFIVKSTDGVIRAAFDACDVCYHAKKGYSQEGDIMVCNNCGRRFPTALINVEQGGCNPAPLVREVEGDQLVINVADIASGAKYF